MLSSPSDCEIVNRVGLDNAYPIRTIRASHYTTNRVSETDNLRELFHFFHSIAESQAVPPRIIAARKIAAAARCVIPGISL